MTKHHEYQCQSVTQLLS